MLTRVVVNAMYLSVLLTIKNSLIKNLLSKREPIGFFAVNSEGCVSL